jgi:hypothetical protein
VLGQNTERDLAGSFILFLFFLFFWVSEILRFDLHFVFVLVLDCDDSQLKEGVVKIFGFDL